VVEHLHKGDHVHQGRDWGTVIQVRHGLIQVRWDRVGLLSLTRKTWERRDDVDYSMPD
jgi:hypothetical protein